MGTESPAEMRKGNDKVLGAYDLEPRMAERLEPSEEGKSKEVGSEVRWRPPDKGTLGNADLITKTQPRRSP